MDMKIFISKQMWRIRQAQTFYSVIFASFTIAALYSPYFPFSTSLVTTLSLAVMILASFALVGYIIDRKLKMWEIDAKTLTERNPYSYYLLSEKEKIIIQKDLAMMKNMYICMRLLDNTNHQNSIEKLELSKALEEQEKWILKMNRWVETGMLSYR